MRLRVKAGREDELAGTCPQVIQGRVGEGANGSSAFARIQRSNATLNAGVTSCPARCTATENAAASPPQLMAMARTKGVSGYLGDGTSRWPAVHVRDAARLYRLALEQDPAGTVLNAVGEEGVAVREIAEAIGRNLNPPTKSRTSIRATTSAERLRRPTRRAPRRPAGLAAS